MNNCYTKCLLVLAMIGFLSFGWVNTVSAQFVTIGTGTSTTGGTSLTSLTPFGTYYEDGKTQMLYRASELVAAGASATGITSIGFEVASANSQTMNGFTIKVKNTSANSLGAYVTGLTTVYTSTGAQSVSNGWNDFVLPVPYVWNGSDNLVIEVCFDNSAYGNNSTVKYSSTSFTSTKGSYCDGCGSGCSLTSSTTNVNNADHTDRVNTRFKFLPPPANNAGVTKVDTPLIPACVLDSNVVVSIRNSGTVNLTSVTVNWKVNGVLKTPVNWTGNLTPSSSGMVNLGTSQFNSNANNDIVVWTTLPNNITDSSTVDDTLNVVLRNSLNGTYTIDNASGASADFNSFVAAQNALNTYGICGPVIFNVADATYNEKIDAKSLVTSSATNTVTYQSASGNNTAVKITSTSTGGNYTVRIDDGDYYTFKNITIENLGTSANRAVVMENGAKHNTIEGCKLVSPTSTSSYSTARSVVYINGTGNDSNTIKNNTITGGTYGINYNANSSSPTNGVKILNNKLENQYQWGVYINGLKNAKVNGNYVKSDASYNWSGYGIQCVGSVETEIVNNYIDEGTGSAPTFYYGIGLSNSYGAVNNWTNVTGNRVKFRRYGIYSSSGVFNAFTNNTVFATQSTNSSGRALYLTSGTSNKVFNNNLISGQGVAYYISGSPVSESNNNNFYSSGTNTFYMGNNYTDLAAFQATGFDSASVEVVNVTSDTNTLVVCNDSLNGKGKANPWGMADFQGDVRHMTTPDIGADEFETPATFSLGVDRVLCAGDSITLHAYYFDSVVWNGTDTANMKLITTPGSYSVKAWNVCGTAYDTIVVTPQAQPNLSNTLNICAGDSATLNPGISNGTYNWSVNSDTSETITVKTAGTYKVTIVDAHGCQSVDSTVVSKSVAVNLADSVEFCEGNNATLDAVISGTYLWSDAGNTTTQTLTVTASGSYSVTVTDAHNCVSKDTTVVTKVLNPVASFNITQNNYGTVFLNNTSQNGSTWAWDFGDGNTQNTQNVVAHSYAYTTADKEYTIKLVVTNKCGSDSVTKKITVNSTVGVEDLDANTSIDLYPNPVKEQLTLAIDTKENVDASVRLTNISGQEVINQTIGSFSGNSTTSIDLTNVAKGVYFVNVRLNDKNVVYKIIKH